MDDKTPPDAEEKGARAEAPCFSCRHFYITYDPAFPYGCRAARFKSRLMPATEMYVSSGLGCQFFEQKAQGKKR